MRSTMNDSTTEPIIRHITPDDLDAYRDLRLEALRTHPLAVGADYEENLAQPREFWANRIAPGDGVIATIFVAEAGGELVGMTGIRAEQGRKAKHAAFVWGVFVRVASASNTVLPPPSGRPAIAFL